MNIRSRVGLLAILTPALVAGLLWAGTWVRPREAGAPRVGLEPGRVLADGYDRAILTVHTGSREAPRITLRGAASEVAGLARRDGLWLAEIRAGIVPGTIRVQVAVAGRRNAAAELTALPDWSDRDGDGTPDVLRLDDDSDRQAFRRWFAYLAEAQYFADASRRPAEIVDCAALIRYAYREALRAHDPAWAEASGLHVVPAFDSVAKYRYPHTPLARGLFRVTPGPLRPADVSNGAFLQFADAQTLWRFNTHRAGRDLGRALPGDLLFFRQSGERVNFHSMIYLGESLVRPDGRRYVVYHTGPEGSDPGEIRRLTIEELMAFPRAEWRPLPSNGSFLGVARWNILRKGETDEAR